MNLSVPGACISISRTLVKTTNKRNRKREWEVALLKERTKILTKVVFVLVKAGLSKVHSYQNDSLHCRQLFSLRVSS